MFPPGSPSGPTRARTPRAPPRPFRPPLGLIKRLMRAGGGLGPPSLPLPPPSPPPPRDPPPRSTPRGAGWRQAAGPGCGTAPGALRGGCVLSPNPSRVPTVSQPCPSRVPALSRPCPGGPRPGEAQRCHLASPPRPGPGKPSGNGGTFLLLSSC